MKKIFLTTILMLAATLLVFVACEKDPDPTDDNTSGVDFGSHNVDGSIMVRNNTNYRLVAFKGDLQPQKLIGGIPAHADGHRLPMSQTLFDKTEAFPMILLTEKQYNDYKPNLDSQKNTPFTRVFVFFNKQGENLAVYEISGDLGGNNTLSIMSNSDTINVELRLNGTAGETLGYAPAGILESKFKLIDGNYSVFPVFKRYNAVRDVVTTVYPKRTSDGNAWRQTFSFGEGISTATINLSTVLSQTSFTVGAAWVYVNNQTTSGGIRFVQGSQVQTTATGLTNIMTNRTFQINMPNVGQSYAESVIVSNWQFGPDGDEVTLQAGENDTTPVTSKEVFQNKMYTVTVSGDMNVNGIKAWISGETDIPIGDAL
jgi:hypothetical protein